MLAEHNKKLKAGKKEKKVAVETKTVKVRMCV